MESFPVGLMVSLSLVSSKNLNEDVSLGEESDFPAWRFLLLDARGGSASCPFPKMASREISGLLLFSFRELLLVSSGVSVVSFTRRAVSFGPWLLVAFLQYLTVWPSSLQMKQDNLSQEK